MNNSKKPVNLFNETLELEEIQVSKIKTGERFRKDYKGLDELSKSIEEKGLISPIAVKITEDGYELLAGGRRLEACKMLRMELIPARIYSKNLTEHELRLIELEENIQREDLSWQEEAQLKKRIYNTMIDIYGKRTTGNEHTKGSKGISMKDVAEAMNVSKSSFYEDCALAEMIEVLPELKKCKTRSDAMKVVKGAHKKVTTDKIVQQITNKQSKTPERKLKDELVNSYMLKDFFTGIKKVPNGSVNFVECDPPYGIDLFTTRKGQGTKLTMADYNEVSDDFYAEFLRSLFKELYRVMAENSWLVFWFGPDPWFQKIADIAHEAGFEFKTIPGIWAKERGQTMRPELYLANCYEMFFYMRKGNAQLQKPARNNIFSFPGVAPSARIHPTERPVALISELLETFTIAGDQVLVPFLGSGNTLLAACNLNRKAFGYDLSEEYKKSFIVRVHEGTYKNY